MFVVATSVLGVFDLMFTLTAEAVGLLHEGNPLARMALLHGAWSLVLYKAVLHSAGGLLLVCARDSSSGEVAAAAGFVLYSALALWWLLCLETYAQIPVCLLFGWIR
jgi:hypothetical protein